MIEKWRTGGKAEKMSMTRCMCILVLFMTDGVTGCHHCHIVCTDLSSSRASLNSVQSSDEVL